MKLSYVCFVDSNKTLVIMQKIICYYQINFSNGKHLCSGYNWNLITKENKIKKHFITCNPAKKWQRRDEKINECHFDMIL